MLRDTRGLRNLFCSQNEARIDVTLQKSYRWQSIYLVGISRPRKLNQFILRSRTSKPLVKGYINLLSSFQFIAKSQKSLFQFNSIENNSKKTASSHYLIACHFFSTLIVLFDKIRNLSCLTSTLYLLSNSGLIIMSCHPQSSALAVSLQLALQRRKHICPPDSNRDLSKFGLAVWIGPIVSSAILDHNSNQ